MLLMVPQNHWEELSNQKRRYWRWWPLIVNDNKYWMILLFIINQRALLLYYMLSFLLLRLIFNNGRKIEEKKCLWISGPKIVSSQRPHERVSAVHWWPQKNSCHQDCVLLLKICREKRGVRLDRWAGMPQGQSRSNWEQDRWSTAGAHPTVNELLIVHEGMLKEYNQLCCGQSVV